MNEKRATIPFEVKQIEEDDNFFMVEGLGSTFGNVDLGSDIAVRGCFKRSISELKRNARPIPDLPNERKILPMLWQHDMEKPIGSFISVEEVPEGLMMTAILPKADTFVSGRVVPQLKVGSVGELSIGYITRDIDFDKDGNRLLKEVELIETSLVTMAMNPQALVLGMKNASGKSRFVPLAELDYKWNEEQAIERVKSFTEDNDEYTVEYKYPILDVIDDELKVVPDALFIAAAKINIDKKLSGNDRNTLIRQVEHYYQELKLNSPFTKSQCFRVDDLDNLDEKTLETVFNRGIILNRKNAKRIIAALRDVKRDANEPDERDADTANLVASMKQLNQSLTKKV